MKLINENQLENICGGGKITKAIKAVCTACILLSMLETGILVAYANVKKDELEKRKNLYDKEEIYIIEV